MTEWVAVSGFVSAAIYLVLLLLKAFLSLRYFYTHREFDEKEAAITVLQPILGGDPSLETTLRTNLDNAPPNALFLWLMDTNDKIGNETSERVASEFPGRVKILTCPDCPVESNPKTWKLNYAFKTIETEFIAILDDDTLLEENHLNRAIAILDESDLYTGLPRYLNGSSLWSSLIAHFVNNNSIVTYLSLLFWIRPITINGMFYVMRTSTLDKYGGLNSILNELCDDYAVAKLVRSNNGVIRQGVTAQTIQTSAESGRRYFQVLHRWFVFANVLVHAQNIGIKCLLLVFLGLPPLFFAGSFAVVAAGWLGIAFLCSLILIRHIVLISLHRAVFCTSVRFSLVLSVFSELLQVIHYIHSKISSVIQWRRHRIRVHLDGSFEKQIEAKQ